MDQRDDVEHRKVETPDDLVPIVLDGAEPDQVVKIGAQVTTEIRLQLAAFLREFKDVFAWTNIDMLWIDLEIMVHHLNRDGRSAERSTRPLVKKLINFSPPTS